MTLLGNAETHDARAHATVIGAPCYRLPTLAGMDAMSSHRLRLETTWVSTTIQRRSWRPPIDRGPLGCRAPGPAPEEYRVPVLELPSAFPAHALPRPARHALQILQHGHLVSGSCCGRDLAAGREQCIGVTNETIANRRVIAAASPRCNIA